ncbi:Helicase-like, DEXD box c2 type,DEAD2,P-loop containing nucleoside triphosphate hydrolase,Helicase [Cinara cedri]|uniref:Helicase-like, DEXD box c2 type,DEAD2,P-loop containing nucleoside triphosphate hydrolase,Helicase n=1 Tax=Cinara cedri TaxID=506608 RepID=A0A5E4N1D4_9HEMI|nr:Helicase-like, DEXD box c2 type,DEAD2,P-loop containing nucleoside triphosphate hydrolase,Helicase [Cinara cedri]
MSDDQNFKDVIVKEKLNPPSSFLFPFTPYGIQHDFMTTLYSALENKKLGIFESPTGTGKTLSIICGAVRWLFDHEKRELRQLQLTLDFLAKKKEELSNDDDWIVGQAKLLEQQHKVNEINLMIKALEEFNVNIEQIKKKMEFKKTNVKNSLEVNCSNQKDYTALNKIDNKDFFDEETELLLEEYNECSLKDVDINESSDEKIQYEGVKIYFCSRTHSQLSQFVAEIKKSPYSTTRITSLASRQNYCINKTVKNLKNITLINERCLEMGKSKVKEMPTKVLSSTGLTVKKKKTQSVCKCVYNDKEKIQLFAQEVVTEVRDVEQLINRGEQLSTCPYFASRESIKYSQIVVLPYNTLLHKHTREANGIHLEGNIFIIDEAHNLLDTISHIHSSQINGQQLTHSYSQLIQYKNQYELRFTASNLLYLNQLIYVIGKLIFMLGGTPGESHVEACQKDMHDEKVYTLEDFVHEAEIDHLNMFTLVDFIKNSKICQKIRGYSEKYMPSVTLHPSKPKISNLQAFLKDIKSKNNNKSAKTKEDKSKQPESQTTEIISSNPLIPVTEFIESLMNHCEDGRIVCTRQSFVSKGKLKFLLLNPAVYFKEIVEKARSVIVSGGTMEPISEFKDQLFNSNGNNSDRIVHFSCGHVVPSDHILPMIVRSGPNEKLFDFSYQERSTITMLKEIGSFLENICRIVPAGIVCFFPSYEYEQLVYQHLETNKNIDRILQKKKVFREPKTTNQVDEILKNYAQAITESKSSSKITGALLFSVIGGKLSEGLNFSDDLGRCIIVIGLPYPNIKSAELQEKMKYLDYQMGHGMGQKYYENLCMKAVNQSIGRSVRHQQDYAAVLLLDYRYQRENVKNSLSKWLQPSLKIHPKFGSAYHQLHKFFVMKKKM